MAVLLVFYAVWKDGLLPAAVRHHPDVTFLFSQPNRLRTYLYVVGAIAMGFRYPRPWTPFTAPGHTGDLLGGPA